MLVLYHTWTIVPGSSKKKKTGETDDRVLSVGIGLVVLSEIFGAKFDEYECAFDRRNQMARDVMSHYCTRAKRGQQSGAGVIKTRRGTPSENLVKVRS